MKIYLAGASYTRTMLSLIAADLRDRESLQVISTWHDEQMLPDLRQRAAQDFGQLAQADVIVAFYPFGTGTSCELGYAYGAGKDVIYVHNHPTVNEELDEVPLIAGLLVNYNELSISDLQPQRTRIILEDSSQLAEILDYLEMKYEDRDLEYLEKHENRDQS